MSSSVSSVGTNTLQLCNFCIGVHRQHRLFVHREIMYLKTKITVRLCPLFLCLYASVTTMCMNTSPIHVVALWCSCSSHFATAPSLKLPITRRVDMPTSAQRDSHPRVDANKTQTPRPLLLMYRLTHSRNRAVYCPRRTTETGLILITSISCTHLLHSKQVPPLEIWVRVDRSELRPHSFDERSNVLLQRSSNPR